MEFLGAKIESGTSIFGCATNLMSGNFSVIKLPHVVTRMLRNINVLVMGQVNIIDPVILPTRSKPFKKLSQSLCNLNKCYVGNIQLLSESVRVGNNM